MMELIAARRLNEELLARIAQLEALFGDRINLPVSWRLTPDQRAVVAMLYMRPAGASFDGLIECVWGRIGRDEPDHAKLIICQHVLRIRGAIGRQSAVESIWGFGYRLDDAARAAIATVNAAEGPMR